MVFFLVLGGMENFKMICKNYYIISFFVRTNEKYIMWNFFVKTHERTFFMQLIIKSFFQCLWKCRCSTSYVNICIINNKCSLHTLGNQIELNPFFKQRQDLVIFIDFGHPDPVKVKIKNQKKYIARFRSHFTQ